jgi:hypothetical protein
LWWDEIYLDNTQSRVMLGNSSTWSGCTHLEVQVPSAWASNQITATINQGTFSSGQQAYLYVVDSAGAVNANGYALTMGGQTTNHPPVVTNPGSQNGSVGSLFSLVVSASDPDSDPLVLSASGAPSWITFTDHGNGTATLAGTPGAANTGSWNITISATDTHSAVGTATFSLTVTDAGPPGQPGQPVVR